MKIWKRIAVYGLLAAVFFVGICFPSVVGAVQDIQIGRMRDMVVAKAVQLKMSSNLTMIQKLTVVKEGAASAVKLESAQKMDYQEAYKSMTDGLKLLLPDFAPYTEADFEETEHSIELRMYEENSVILWRFVLEDKNKNQMQVLLDDDTGLILAFCYSLNTAAQDSGWEKNSGSTAIYSDETGVSERDSNAYLYDSVYAAIDLYGMGISDSAEMFAAYYADYLGVIQGIKEKLESDGYDGYTVWLYDPDGGEACEVDIVITDTELSINF